MAGAFYMEKKYGMEGFEVKGFSTPSRKIEIYSETFEKAGFDPLPTYREPDQSPLGDLAIVSKVSSDSDDRGSHPLLYPWPASKHQRLEGEESRTLCRDPSEDSRSIRDSRWRSDHCRIEPGTDQSQGSMLPKR